MHVVVWEVNGRKYATSCDLVAEVVPLVEMESIDGMPEAVRGVAQIHGKRIPVLDTSILSGQEQVESTLGSRLLLIEGEGDESRRYALMVSSVLDVTESVEGSDPFGIFDQMPGKEFLDLVLARMESA